MKYEYLRSLKTKAYLENLKPGLHMVVIIAEHASDVPKKILRLSVHRLQIFLVKHEYLRLLQLCEDQGVSVKLKKACLQLSACDPYDL